jgi:hypothetical protein
MIQSGKPRLAKRGGVWVCNGHWLSVTGETPFHAYNAWLAKSASLQNSLPSDFVRAAYAPRPDVGGFFSSLLGFH